MGDTTAISWTDHTFNPWMGCSKVSPACDHCYAEALGKRTGRVEWGDQAERVMTSEAYWKNPLKWNAKAEAEGRRHRVFCASMADVFEDRDELHDTRQRLLEEVIPETPWLDWQLLTKRPENVTEMVPEDWLTDRSVEEWAGWPHNAWIGTTVENADTAALRIPHLAKIPAPVLFLSCEPLLGHLAARRIDLLGVLDVADWVIVGGESGPGHRPLDLDAAREVRDACRFLEIPFFFKQVGGRTPAAGGHLLDGEEWHQFPKVAA